MIEKLKTKEKSNINTNVLQKLIMSMAFGGFGHFYGIVLFLFW